MKNKRREGVGSGRAGDSRSFELIRPGGDPDCELPPWGESHYPNRRAIPNGRFRLRPGPPIADKAA